MKVSKLLKNIPHFVLQGDENIPVTGICDDSRKCTYGNLFICVLGEKCDGHDYILAAIEHGASVIIVDDLSKIAYVTDTNVVLVLVDDTRQIISNIAAAWFDYPAKKLLTIGITGTKGKTTTAYMTKAILEHAGMKTGIIGTVELFDGKNSMNNINTTPSAIEIQKWLSAMVDNGCEAVVMEVSSQGMKHFRCEAMIFDICAFTNLKPDHIGKGEHRDFFEYRACKSRLFRKCVTGIFNMDDEQTKYVLKGHTCRVLGYSAVYAADYMATDIEKIKFNGAGMSFKFNDVPLQINIPGIFNVYNALCAASIATECGIGTDIIKEALSVVTIRGRSEYVPVSEDFIVLLDYAHNAMSLRVLLKTIREYEPGRIVCLFGCGGNRSKLRRYEMGEVSGRLADYTIITSDNPRDEEPLSIIDDIVSGIEKTSGEYTVIPDRKEAIRFAIENARKGDIIIIAGKGHEAYQEIKGKRYHMDDRELILQAKNG